MWRDRDPYREQQHVPDTLWLVVAVVLFAACGLVWLIGQVAAVLFGAHEHLPVRLGVHPNRADAYMSSDL